MACVGATGCTAPSRNCRRLVCTSPLFSECATDISTFGTCTLASWLLHDVQLSEESVRLVEAQGWTGRDLMGLFECDKVQERELFATKYNVTDAQLSRMDHLSAFGFSRY